MTSALYVATPPLSVLASDAWVRPDTLLDIADDLGADTFAAVDDVVTFVRRGATVTRWRGRLGERGVHII